MTDTQAPAHSAGFDRAALLRPLAIASAVLVATNGLLHLKIWNSDYKDLPSAVAGAWVVKVGFPINAALAVALAIALVVLSRQVLVTIAALAFTAGSLLALILSRNSIGVFGWKEAGWSGDPTLVVIVEVLGLVALVALAALQRADAR